jgi:hypothetical protein
MIYDDSDGSNDFVVIVYVPVRVGCHDVAVVMIVVAVVIAVVQIYNHYNFHSGTW